MPNPFLHQFNVLTSVVSSTLGAWRGSSTLKSVVPGVQPPLPLKLYDIEASPYCRAVREALTALHLDAEIYPCPKGGTCFRAEAARLGGKQQFPLLVDPNSNMVMYESKDIVDYLFNTYGNRGTPAYYQESGLKIPLTMVGTAVRGLRGRKLRAGKQPAQMLHLWSFESSPYSRLVRERLCELEIPYVLHNLGKERWQDFGPAVFRVIPGPYHPIKGGKRETFFRNIGRCQVPYLEDPNTGVKMFESSDIIDYLEATYGA